MQNYGIEIVEGTKISNLTVDVGNTFPNEPTLGELFYKIPENKLYTFNGSVWSAVGDAAGNYLPLTGGTINGNLTVNGSLVSINTTTINVADPIITLGGENPPTISDYKDRGVEFRYYTETGSKVGFFGYDDSTGKFTFIPNATNTSEVFNGTKGVLDANVEWLDILNSPTTLSGYGITDAAPLSHVGSGGTAHANATTSVDGFMSASDKVKLDSISTGANNYILPIATAGTLGGIKKGSGLTISGDGTLSASVTSVNGMTGDVVISYVNYANALQTARTIQASGDAAWLVTFDGSSSVSSNLVLTTTGVLPGSYTTVTVDSKGRVVSGSNPSTLAGFGITDAQPLDADLTSIASLSGTSGFLKKIGIDTWTLDNSTYLTSNQTINLSGDITGNGTTLITTSLSNTGVTAGTYKSVTVDAKGRVTSGTNPTTLSGYGITDATPLSHVGSGGTAHANATTSVAGFMSATDKTKLDGITAGANNYTLPVATASVLGGVKDGAGVTIAGDGTISADVSSVNGMTGDVVVSSITGNAATSSQLQTSRTIGMTGDVTWSVTFDGSGNVTAVSNIATTGVTAGTYKSVTVDAKGRVTSGTNPTTLSGYGITDAAPLSHVGSGGTAHTNATTSVDGFMSAADKTKLDGIASGAAVTSVAGKTGAVTLTPADVSLSNVENKSSATIRSEITLSNITTALGFTPENTTNKNTPNGYVGLDANGKISSGALPAIAITDTFVVNSQVAMLALTAETGDVAIRTDINKSFILKGTDPSLLVDWQELSVPLSGVTTVNGMVGDVVVSNITGNAGTATSLQTARSISTSGDASWSVSFDGTSNVSGTLTLSNSGVTAGTYKSVTVDAKGRVTSGTNPTTIADYGITDAAPLSHVGSGGTAHANATTSVAGFMSAADKTKLDGITPGANSYTLPVATASVLGGVKDGAGVSIAGDGTLSADVTSVNGLTGAVSITSVTGNAGTATTLQTARTISATGDAAWSVSFDGSANASGVLTLANSGVTAGTYTSVTVDAKGRVTAGSTVNSSNIITALGYTPSRTSSSNETNSVTIIDTRAINDTPTSRNAGIFFDFKQNTTNGVVDGGTYNTQLTLRGYGSTSDVSGSNIYQLSFTDNGNMWMRKFASSTVWGSWYKFWHDNNDGAGSGMDSDLLDGQQGTYYLDWTNTTNKPTTLSGYGITDAQPLDADLTAIAALSGTTGLLRKTAANTWTLDTSTYLTNNQSITLSGDVTGTGTTAITTALSTTGVSAGTYGSATVVPQITVDSKGRITAASNLAVTPAWSSITGKPTTLSGYGITDAPTVTGTGATGTWGINISGSAATLTTSRTIWGQSFNGSTNVSGSLTSVGDITGTGAVTLTATAGTLNLTATGANVITASTNGSERLRIDSTGNVGIGETVPTSKLHVKGAGGLTANIQIESTTNADGRLTFKNTLGEYSIGITGAPTGDWLHYDNINSHIIHDYRAGASGYHRFWTNNIERMRVTSAGNVLIGTTTDDGANKLQVNGQVFASTALITPQVASSANLILAAAGANTIQLVTNGIERVRVTSSGNVLIGTTTDDGANKLQVSGSAVVSTSAQVPLTIQSSSTAVYLRYINSGNSAVYTGSTSSGDFDIQTAATTRARVTASGNALIGTTTDDGTNKLQVSGSAIFTGNAQVGSGNTGTRILTLVGATPRIDIDGATANDRDIRFATAGSLRWILRTEGSTESGSNAGSDFSIIRRSDAGADLGQALVIKRNTGNVLIGTTTDSGRRLQVYGSGLFTDASGIQTTIWSEAVTGAGGVGTNSNHPFTVLTNGAERIRVTAAGNVGIGLTPTTYRLEVSGDVQATNFRGALVGNASTATTLQATRTLWGQSFNGSANVTGSLTSVGDITGTGSVTLTATSGALGLSATGANNITLSTNASERARISSGGNLLIATTTDNGVDKLQVNGSASVSSHLVVGGNLTVNGTTTTIHSTVVTIDDPIFTLGGDTAPTVDDNKDRGIEFRWHNGTSAKVGFFGFDDSTGYLTFIPDATNTSEVFSGSLGDIQASNFRGALVGNATTATTLQTARNIWGQSFDGSTNITGNLTSVGNITGTGAVTLTATAGTLGLAATGTNAITASTNGTQRISIGSDGHLYLTAAVSSEQHIRWQFTGRDAYLFGRDSDDAVGLYDTVLGGARWQTDTSGNFVALGNVTAYSDIRLKKDLTIVDNAIDRVKQISGYTYTRIDTNERQMGLIAQEVQKIAPEVVSDDGKTLSIAYGNLMALMVEAIKEQQQQIDQLKSQLNELRNK